MSINFTTASIKNGLTDAKPLLLDVDEDTGVSGRYSQLDIADFEEALFSDKIQDEHSIFTGLGEDKKTVGEYVDPMKDEGYAKFAGEMKEMINSVTDPEMQALFAEQFEATSKAASDRLSYQALKK
ncbi:MAG: hypothetical protein VKK32_04105 [Candidatus Melainabacteria bacterium]|nr:hypothetical protein [Candidatus Melainabacteria bacterium]